MSTRKTNDDMANFMVAVNLCDGVGLETPPNVSEAAGECSSPIHKEKTDTIIDTMLVETESEGTCLLLNSMCA